MSNQRLVFTSFLENAGLHQTVLYRLHGHCCFVNTTIQTNQCESQTLYEWLQAIQQEQLELVQYENSSLVDIQKASDVPANVPMFDSLIVFQNVPRLTVSKDFSLAIANRTADSDDH